LNIWLVNHYAVPPRESSGTRHYDLASRLVERGHSVTIFASSIAHLGEPYASVGRLSEPKEEAVSGVRFVWLPGVGYRRSAAKRLVGMADFAARVARLQIPAGAQRPDIIYGSSPHPFGALAAQVLARRAAAPFVLEVRDLWPSTLSAIAGLREWHPLMMVMRWIEHRLYTRSQGIVSLLAGATDYLVSRGGRREDITFIPNGIDSSRFAAIGEPVEGDVFRYAYLGTLSQVYGLDTLLDAMKLIKEAGRSNIVVDVIGDGPERARLEARAKAEGLAIVFHGRVPKSEVADRLRQAHACVAVVRDSPLYENGISFNKFYEYLASGRPTAIAISAFNNPIAEAGAGISVRAGDAGELAEAMMHLADSPEEERRKMGAAGRSHVLSHYDFNKLTNELEACLAGAIERFHKDELHHSLSGPLRRPL
jgi:glycosyltransferase involved in cell wall biosynthesis